MISKVIATFSVNGFHNWSDAPADLSYLRERHRHSFVYKVEVRVAHDNRQVEFHQLQRAARAALLELYQRGSNAGEFEFGARSCEMLAKELFGFLSAREWLVSAVETWEDEECGARVEAGA